MLEHTLMQLHQETQQIRKACSQLERVIAERDEYATKDDQYEEKIKKENFALFFMAISETQLKILTTTDAKHTRRQLFVEHQSKKPRTSDEDIKGKQKEE